MSNPKGDITRLLVVDDDPGMHTLVHDLFASESTSVLFGATLSDGLRIAAKHRIDVVLLDHLLPDGEGVDRIADFISHDRLLPILYVTALAGSKTAIEAMKRGAFEYISKPIDFKLLRQRVAEAIEYRRLTRLPVLVDSVTSTASESDVLVGRCRGMQEVYKSIGRLSNLRSPILIEGEVGTGKEMIARSIHQNGYFASGPFRKISSKEFEDAELQVELFGGTNANSLAAGTLAAGTLAASDPAASDPIPVSPKPSIGKLSALLECSGGTLMIDDIDNWSIATQSRLLRFFQSNAVDGIASDTRVILATSYKIRDLVQTGKIRNDLFYFVSPFVIRVPALRERQEDLELLVSHFMQRIAHVSSTHHGHGPPRVSSTAMQLMKDYDWPGNIAELKSTLQGVLTESRGAVLATDALRRFLNPGRSKELMENENATASKTTPTSSQALVTNNRKPESESVWDLRAFVEKQVANGTERLYENAIALLDEQLLNLVMQHTSGNRVKAAKILGITRTSLRRKMNGGLQSETANHAPDELRPDDENA